MKASRSTLVHALVAALLIVPAMAGAQSRGQAAMPARRAAEPQPAQIPILLRDGAVVADFGRGYERVIRSCTAYTADPWPAGRGGTPSVGDPAPQMGAASRPPGANGLPAAPGLSPVPGGTGTTRTNASSSGSTLRPVHSAWRTAGPAYYDAACWYRDRYGRLQLHRF